MTFPERTELSESQVAALIAEHPDVAHVALERDRGIITAWGGSATRLYGWTAEEAIGQRMLDLTVPSELHAALNAGHDKHVELKGRLQGRRYEVEHVDRDGRRFLAEVHCYPIIDGGTTTLHLFLTDLSVDGIPDADSRLAAIVASSADAIVVADGNRLITDWNPAAERLFGWSRSAIVGMPVDAVVPVDLRAQSHAAWRTAQTTPGFVRVDTQRLRQDGTLIDVELTLTRLDDRSTASSCSATYRGLSGRCGTAEPAELDSLGSVQPAEPLQDPGGRRIPVPSGGNRDHEPALFEQLLELAREHLSMDVAWLSQLTEDEQRFQVVVGEAARFGLKAGHAVPRAETICARVVAGVTGPVHGDVQADPELERLARIQEMGLGAYIGVPVRLRDGRTFGTLCAIDHRIRPDLSEHDADLMRLLAGILAGQIDRRRDETIDDRSRAEVTALSALLAALEARDQYAGEHSAAVVELALSVAAALGASDDEIETVSHVATLHDLGKVGIPDAILRKPGPLTEGEWALMREHPAIGARIVAALAPLAHLAAAIRAEHERWDGAGYPDGLAGEQIPLAARITLACDAYHAMISDRPYRAALGQDAAVTELRENAGSQFDPAVVGALVRALDES